MVVPGVRVTYLQSSIGNHCLQVNMSDNISTCRTQKCSRAWFTALSQAALMRSLRLDHFGGTGRHSPRSLLPRYIADNCRY